MFLDLEDAVAPAEKEAARATVSEAVATGEWGDTILAVRVNDWSTPWTTFDILEVVARAGPRLDEIVLPKVEGPAQVVAADLAKRPASALAFSKRLLYELDGLSFEEGIARGAEINAEARMTEECRAGVRAFLEGRGQYPAISTRRRRRTGDGHTSPLEWAASSKSKSVEPARVRLVPNETIA